VRETPGADKTAKRRKILKAAQATSDEYEQEDKCDAVSSKKNSCPQITQINAD
jgi:hypothetical protein